MKAPFTPKATLLLAMAFCQSATATTQQAHDEAGALSNALIEKGVSLHGQKIGYLRHGAIERIRVNLEAGRNYVFLIGGCLDAYDMDAALFDDSKREPLVLDADNEKRALLTFTPEETKQYTLGVQMANSTKNGAHYAVLLGETSEGPGQSQPLGEKTIDMEIEVVNEDGKREALRSIIGDSKYLYVRMWATWCPPCIALLPNLQARSQSLGSSGIKVITMNNELGQGGEPGGDIERASIELTRRRISVPSYAEISASPIAQRLGVNSVPRTIILDREGNVLFNGHPIDEDLPSTMTNLGVANFDLKEGLQPKAHAN